MPVPAATKGTPNGPGGGEEQDHAAE